MKPFKQIINDHWSTSSQPDFPLPWDNVNDFLNGGLRRRHLTLLAGRPGMGKTTLAVNAATHLAHSFKVGFFSIEMTPWQILDLVAMYVSGGTRRPENMKEQLGKLNLHVDDNPVVDARYIADISTDNEFDIVVIDYLQKMLPLEETRTQNENQQITATLRALTGMWKDLNCNILLLSQLSRGPKGRMWSQKFESEQAQLEAARPIEEDLRGSGSIEQDANEIMFIFRPDKYRKYRKNDGETEIIIAKNRHGKEGSTHLLFSPEEGRFE